MGMLGGPNLAVFFLGVFYPWSNRWGAFIGNLLGIAMSVWIYVGSKFYPARAEKIGKLEHWTYSCNLTDDISTTLLSTSTMIPNVNFTTIPDLTVTMVPAVNVTMPTPLPLAAEERPAIADFYELSYMFVGTAGFLVTLISGLIISGLTKFQDPAKLNPELYVRWLPFMKKYDNGVTKNGTANNAYAVDMEMK